MNVAQKVRLAARPRCFSEHVRAQLAQVDTEQGEIVKTYPNPNIVTVRFPGKIPGEGDFIMDILTADLELVFSKRLIDAA